MDITFRIVDKSVEMDIFHKPTDSFNFLNYHSSHPLHTRENIALSLAKRIVKIVSINRYERLDELKDHLIKRDHPILKINYAFSRVFQPKKKIEDKVLVFSSTYNPSHMYNRRIIKNIAKEIRGDSMKKAFCSYDIVLGTRQPKSLRTLLVKSKFS